MNHQETSVEKLESCPQSTTEKAIDTLFSVLCSSSNKSKKIVYVDMDGVLVDLHAKLREYPEDVVKSLGNDIDKLPDLFLDPPPMEGAIEAFNILCSLFDVYIINYIDCIVNDNCFASRCKLELHQSSPQILPGSRPDLQRRAAYGVSRVSEY